MGDFVELHAADTVLTDMKIMPFSASAHTDGKSVDSDNLSFEVTVCYPVVN